MESIADLSHVLVAIPALNEAAHIAATLASLIGPETEGATIVVADGGSTDGTVAIVAQLAALHPGLRLMHNPAKLQSAGINGVVARHAEPKHRILVRCDAHAIYPPGYIARVASSLETRDVAALAVPMDAWGADGFQKAAAWIVDTPLGSGGAAHRGGARSGFVDHGHHAGISLDWFRRIGGYDPDFSHNEDAEFDLRLRDAGGQIWLDAGIRLDYVMRPSLSALVRQYLNYGQGRARTVLKHRIRPRLRQMVPVLNLLGLMLALPLSLFFASALLWPALYLASLALASMAGAVGLGRAGLWAGLALGAIHLAWGYGFLRVAAPALWRRFGWRAGAASGREDALS